MIKNQYHRELSMSQSSYGSRTLATNMAGVYRSVDQYTVLPGRSSPAGSFVTKDVKIPRKQMEKQCECRDIFESHDREIATPINERVINRNLVGTCDADNEEIGYDDKGLYSVYRPI